MSQNSVMVNIKLSVCAVNVSLINKETVCLCAARDDKLRNQNQVKGKVMRV